MISTAISETAFRGYYIIPILFLIVISYGYYFWKEHQRLSRETKRHEEFLQRLSGQTSLPKPQEIIDLGQGDHLVIRSKLSEHEERIQKLEKRIENWETYYGSFSCVPRNDNPKRMLRPKKDE